MFIHCPKCKSVATVPIAYGKPGGEMMEAEKYGLIHLAGCVIDDVNINRHCKACGFDWACNIDEFAATQLPKSISAKDMGILLNDLESVIQSVKQNIERKYMQLGRDPHSCQMSDLMQMMHQYHQAWSLFLERLHRVGDPIVVVSTLGETLASYSYETASLYYIKMQSSIYYGFERLAKASHWLGQASRGEKNDIEELKNASIALQEARQELDHIWNGIRSDTLSYGGRYGRG